MSKKQTTFVTTANPELARGMQQLRQSGAAGYHQDKRTRRKRTRSASRRAAIREFR